MSTDFNWPRICQKLVDVIKIQKESCADIVETDELLKTAQIAIDSELGKELRLKEGKPGFLIVEEFPEVPKEVLAAIEKADPEEWQKLLLKSEQSK